jgi:hypothetical protein
MELERIISDEKYDAVNSVRLSLLRNFKLTYDQTVITSRSGKYYADYTLYVKVDSLPVLLKMYRAARFLLEGFQSGYNVARMEDY